MGEYLLAVENRCCGVSRARNQAFIVGRVVLIGASEETSRARLHENCMKSRTYKGE